MHFFPSLEPAYHRPAQKISTIGFEACNSFVAGIGRLAIIDIAARVVNLRRHVLLVRDRLKNFYFLDAPAWSAQKKGGGEVVPENRFGYLSVRVGAPE